MKFDNNEYSLIEKKYIKSVSNEHRKKYAQYFTPYPIADLMVQWLMKNKDIRTFLDPAFGLGVFANAFLKHETNTQIIGFEIDDNIYSQSIEYYNSNNIILNKKDYMFNDWLNKYDAIICNPPYFKFHDYDNLSVLNEVSKMLSIKLSGFTNLYTLFLLKSVYQLNINGRLSYIIPSEFLNSDYGVNIKEYLIKSKTLRYVVVIDFEENVFDDALTTACIILCSKDTNNEVGFINVSSLSDLQSINSIINGYPEKSQDVNYITLNELDPTIKWRGYYQKQNSINYKNLVPFSKYAKVSRGIATGANDYFIFSKTKANKYNISPKYLLPCICKSIDINSNFFTEHDFEVLKEQDKSIFLLNAKEPLDSNIKKYIEYGVENNIDKKYLTACRKPWYSLENRQPSPIWVSVFNRNGLRFIRNEAGVSNLTTFHCIYPNEADMFHATNIDLLFAYLLTDVSKDIFQDNQREYGDGLKKFEPNDINKGLIMDINLIDDITQNLIIKKYQKYRDSEIIRNPNNELLKEIEDIFISYFKL